MRKKTVKIEDSTGNSRVFSSIAECASFFKVDESTIRKTLGYFRNYKVIFDVDIVPEEPQVKILCLDIETAPVKAFVWKLWKENVGLNQIISDWFMLTWSAKWLHEDKVYSNKLTSREAINEDDKRICISLWQLLDEADIVIAHNGQQFDIPKINARFVINGLMPTSPYKQIDTLIVARKEFGFTSNKLDALAKHFNVDSKIHTTFELWKGCLEGDIQSLMDMETYNIKDVVILEKVYYKLRPWIKGHPNLDLYKDSDTAHCPICGGHSLELIPDKSFYTQACKYQVYRCKDCKGVSRAKQSDNFMNKKKISAIPR